MIRTVDPSPVRQTEDEWGSEPGFDLGHIARLMFWGVIAVSSLAGAYLAARTDLGRDRLAAAWQAFLTPPAKSNAVPATPPPATVANPVQSAADVPSSAPAAPAVPALRPVHVDELQALDERVKALAADRDRLAARLDAVETTLDVTGSIGKTATTDTAGTVAWNTVPLPASKPSFQPFANMLPFAAEPVTDWVVTKAEFGIDIGAAPSLDGLRAQWAAIKAQHGALLDGLRPAVVIRETARSGHELRLIAGPLTNAALAARICVVLTKYGRECRATAFEGQRLALR